ncbi:prephenate dehydrogenase/arogenate dehydrogenase family protein [Natronobacterium gregoryi]|uniref:Prephenate dehydrogenase n=2 Tax=Natronobacterium gregoryi TaxID=44930 RepID=L0AEB5_NATGS|nr:prephenate dehydrogenase/arogenate dehydrogenase family protein [Natronobacterium gregoryi]AFZ71487.1 prephenate dehydrogenase [Natronobacterium gregoryi SP2]ELY66790.1 prephenate dehydrogenase [Natronobacterium gregoryi SP2]PLK18692.1 prephenate dehydrogenase/arogenate dehydrogenase family protein [Natronobacterium gregoryi SP2]SFJ68332.1 prephenate dehydrogenase [Natronobacterium gregoryi]
MDVLIVGAGSMGTWFGQAIDAPVTFADVDPEAAVEAADVVGDADVTDLEADDRYDVVCFAVPMAHVTDAVAAHADRAERAVVDVSGVMEPAVEAMREHAPERERVSLHPLFAPERAPGSIAVVRDREGPVTEALLADLEMGGNDRHETTAAEHDKAMETVQATTHAAVLAFALAAESESIPGGFETPIYEQMKTLAEQMTEGTPRVYADIQDAFDGADVVAEAARRIAAADGDEFERLYRDAAAQWQEGDHE